MPEKSASDLPPPRTTVACPTCGGPSLYAPENRFRPFCCERCKNLDLGAWASEQFRVPSEPPQEPLTDDEPPRQH